MDMGIIPVGPIIIIITSIILLLPLWIISSSVYGVTVL
jgi:hypothetical protein